MNKRKGIFGGTFDPIHNGHLHVAYEALYRLNLDKVIFMPSGKPPHKTNKVITDSEIRIELVKAAIEKEKKFIISSYEIEKLGLSYTYETLEYFKGLEPDTEWYFITGTDCLMDIRTWKSIDKIFNSCKFVVFNRSGYFKEKVIEQKNKIEMEYGTSIIYLDIPVIDISSTEVRNKVKASEQISYLVPDKVENILNINKLYK